MPHLGNFKSKVPLWEGKEIRVDQLCSLYVLANWCKTDEDRLLSVDEVCEIAATEIFRTNIRQNAAFVKRLRGPGYDLADRVHDLLESHEDIKSHFGNKALELYYSKHAGRQVPPLSIPGSVFLCSIGPAEKVLTTPTV